jgi:hypothetical protein
MDGESSLTQTKKPNESERCGVTSEWKKGEKELIHRPCDYGKVSMFPWNHSSRALCRIDTFPGVLNLCRQGFKA